MKKKMTSSNQHPDHTAKLVRLRRIRGQIEGLERMIGERRYCPEILVQIQAVSSALRSLGASILEGHLDHCLRNAMIKKKSQDAEQKIREVVELFRRS
ncbi:MAG: metal-sensitive transcriptional regulator [Bdellovibrionales bacterium]|nr:metal-sensitive transcriptional regulator [Bdellovibrionales bacterium]